jgi:acetoacetyl-CoA synthetase
MPDAVSPPDSDSPPVGTPIWTPSPEILAAARIRDFTGWLAARGIDTGDGYHDLWRWSVTELGAFWEAVRDYFDVRFSQPAETALGRERMPGAVWFPGARMNYVDQVFRDRRADAIAVVQAGEGAAGMDLAVQRLTWRELESQVGAFAATLNRLGVVPGDRVVGYLPDITEAVVAFLGCAAVGAVWSCTGQDYAAPGAVTRFAQLDPAVLVVADGYRHGGREHDRREASATVRAGLPTVRATVVVTRLGLPVDPALGWIPWSEAVAADPARVGAAPVDGRPVEPVQVPFDHPLWVLFSSGTTGMPKGIVHGHGGVVLEHLKSLALHLDVGPADTYLWYTTPSWMMWNYRVAGLLVGATIVCYDGSPSHPGPGGLWALAARLGVTVLGTSPAYLLACAKAGVEPARDHDLAALRTLGVTGATLPAPSYVWARDHVGAAVQVASISGGTDVVSAFAGGVPTLPVWPGELSAACLGVALDAFDPDGASMRGEVGELVVTRPMPSMPIRFWNDPDGVRYREAYFDVYPGVWRHGDWITLTDRGTVEIHGRSDSTLNRNGIRMGSADIYQAVERVPEVLESMVIGAEQPGGGYWMPLFVTLAPGVELDESLRGRIAAAIREHASPRHLPDEIIVAPGIPHTRTGKKLEVPVKRMLQGQDPGAVVDTRVVDDPDVLAWYAAQATAHVEGVSRER